MLTWVLRGKFIRKMDLLRPRIQANDPGAISVFRKIHKSAILINVIQLAAILGSLGSF